MLEKDAQVKAVEICASTVSSDVKIDKDSKISATSVVSVATMKVRQSVPDSVRHFLRDPCFARLAILTDRTGRASSCWLFP